MDEEQFNKLFKELRRIANALEKVNENIQNAIQKVDVCEVCKKPREDREIIRSILDDKDWIHEDCLEQFQIKIKI